MTVATTTAQGTFLIEEQEAGYVRLPRLAGNFIVWDSANGFVIRARNHSAPLLRASPSLQFAIAADEAGQGLLVWSGLNAARLGIEPIAYALASSEVDPGVAWQHDRFVVT